MPVQTGKDKKGCYARWGNRGAKYYYTCGNTTSMNKAKQKAHIQGAAIGEAVSDAPWSKVNKSKLPKSAFLWIEGDGKKKSQWHLPYKDAQGNINLGALRAISQALGGARTGKPMNIPSDVRKKINNLLKRYKIGTDKKSDADLNMDELAVREAETGLWCLMLAKKLNTR